MKDFLRGYGYQGGASRQKSAYMTSSAVQNPFITYMVLTARAVDYAHKELN